LDEAGKIHSIRTALGDEITEVSKQLLPQKKKNSYDEQAKIQQNIEAMLQQKKNTDNKKKHTKK
jgi:hypothetical protein